MNHRRILAEMFLAAVAQRPDKLQVTKYTITDPVASRVWWIGIDGGLTFRIREPFDICIGNGWFDRLGKQCFDAARDLQIYKLTKANE